MADGDQNQQPPRYWFPYWSGAPPAVRPQVSRRLSPTTAPSSPRRPSPSHPRQPTAPATRGAAPPTPPHASSRPSPSRASPLAPIRELPPQSNTNSNAAAPARPPPKPVALPATPKTKDVDVVPQPEKTAVHPTAAAETKHGKGDEHHHKEADKEKKDEHKSKDKKNHAGEDSKHGKGKEKKNNADAGEESKHKEKDKEKKHHADAGEEGKHGKEAKAEHGKLHGEIKAGVADMVRRATGAGHGQGHPVASVITLAGENKGASMKVGGKSKDGSWKEHHGGHRLDGGTVDGKTDGQKKQGMMTALINSNVQVINNSLLLQSSCSGGDPGVHLKLSAKSAKKDKQKHAAGPDKSDKAAGKKLAPAQGHAGHLHRR
ncbi:hypothetical protein CFC21_039183 [Triticum aestivum]|uniref:Uncharacterized protein n=3 Tax=Triticum TaxID=4564 RepID=A0A9R1FDZ4_WHEAT|nr:serine/arginine repetitive matrix protein 1-like [Triticum aestivum]KAF7027111.1 hypothetical protein CFC21_039183 [Triticum aestivum]CDM80556.1 unnamed protein product [Triticum aestivum]VAH71303.1 unnamed protein product [Triticum turgidum subsp. durum]